MKDELLLFTLFAVVQGNHDKQGHAEQPTPYNNIQFSPKLIPLVTDPLPVFELGEPVLVPHDSLHDIAKNVVPDIELKQLDCGALAAYDNNTLMHTWTRRRANPQCFLYSNLSLRGMDWEATRQTLRVDSTQTVLSVQFSTLNKLFLSHRQR
jgi:hypothetical protein